jgi:hypothetical protein
MNDAIELAARYDEEGRHDDAVNALARATRAGDFAAMTALGKRLIIGDRAPLLPAEGVRFLGEAMQGGRREAALQLATLSGLGAHVPQSWSRAIALLVRAAELGSQSARGQLYVLAGQAPKDSVPPLGWRGLSQRIDLSDWLSIPPGETLHEAPVVRCVPECIPDTACTWLIERARGRLRRALIYDPVERADIAHTMRTNSAAGFNLMEADVVQIIVQHRIAVAVGLPIHHLEGPTVLRYQEGEQITNHFDFVDPAIPNYSEEIRRRGERIITFLIYLNDGFTAGETDFPEFGLRYKGRRRDGVFFVNALPNGQPDTRTVHAGRPPVGGEKWVFSQFIRNRPVFLSCT